MGLKDEIRKLKKAAGPGPGDEQTDEETMSHYGEFWEMQMEWESLHLIRGLEPDFTLDERGGFRNN